MKMKACSTFTVNGLVLSIGAMGVSLLAATSSHADVCTDPQTAVVYDSTVGDEPDEADPA